MCCNLNNRVCVPIFCHFGLSNWAMSPWIVIECTLLKLWQFLSFLNPGPSGRQKYSSCLCFHLNNIDPTNRIRCIDEWINHLKITTVFVNFFESVASFYLFIFFFFLSIPTYQSERLFHSRLQINLFSLFLSLIKELLCRSTEFDSSD